MVFIEDNPNDADPESDRRDEPADHLSGNRRRDAGFVSLFINHRYSGYPFSERAPENPGWDYEVSEDDEDVDDASLRAENAAP